MNDIYVQRINASGVAQWAAGGVALCTQAAEQQHPANCHDGADGAVVGWADFRNGNADVFARRVSAARVTHGAVNGVAICATVNSQADVRMVSDSEGGAILTWNDYRADGDIYAQRLLSIDFVDPSWPANGRALCTATSTQMDPRIVSDGAGGAIIAWNDGRTGPSDIYGQRIQSSGVVDPGWPTNGSAVCTATGVQTIGSPEPRIHTVRDVPNDQGGRVNVTWQASYLDTDPSPQVGRYWVLRSLTSSASKAHEGMEPVELDNLTPAMIGRMQAGATITTEADAVTYYWELIGNVTALHLVSGFGHMANTLGDSTAAYNPRTHFMVVAWNNTGTQYWASAPDSGYSADNLPPDTPALLTGQYSGGSTALHWIPNTEADFAYYRVYRGTSPGFTPDAGNRIATPSDTGHVDAGGIPHYYKVSAVDEHGNESGCALLSPNGTLDTDGPSTPALLTLPRPSPDPARGALTLRFTLPRETHVRLTLHDASGRLVRTLTDGVRSAAEHSTEWDGRDDRGSVVRGGLYFARLEAEGQSEVARLTWLR